MTGTDTQHPHQLPHNQGHWIQLLPRQISSRTEYEVLEHLEKIFLSQLEAKVEYGIDSSLYGPKPGSGLVTGKCVLYTGTKYEGQGCYTEHCCDEGRLLKLAMSDGIVHCNYLREALLNICSSKNLCYCGGVEFWASGVNK